MNTTIIAAALAVCAALATQVAMADECSTIYVNGKAVRVCKPSTTTPTCSGPFCPPRPTR